MLRRRAAGQISAALLALRATGVRIIATLLVLGTAVFFIRAAGSSLVAARQIPAAVAVGRAAGVLIFAALLLGDVAAQAQVGIAACFAGRAAAVAAALAALRTAMIVAALLRRGIAAQFQLLIAASLTGGAATLAAAGQAVGAAVVLIGATKGAVVTAGQFAAAFAALPAALFGDGRSFGRGPAPATGTLATASVVTARFFAAGTDRAAAVFRRAAIAVAFDAYATIGRVTTLSDPGQITETNGLVRAASLGTASPYVIVPATQIAAAHVGRLWAADAAAAMAIGAAHAAAAFFV